MSARWKSAKESAGRELCLVVNLRGNTLCRNMAGQWINDPLHLAGLRSPEIPEIPEILEILGTRGILESKDTG